MPTHASLNSSSAAKYAGLGDWISNVEAYPPPVSAHVDDCDSADPSRTVDNDLVASAMAGDRGSQRRI